MYIQQIKIAKLNIPLVRTFTTALRTTNQIEDIVVCLVTDTGLLAYGSAAATPVITGDSAASIIGAIEILAHKLIGANLDNFEQLLLMLQNIIVNNNSAKAALDMALYDLVAQTVKLPLYKFLGGGSNQLKTLTTISLKDSAEMIADAKLLSAQGFSTLKVKLGHSLAKDSACLQAIREAVLDEVVLIADANQAWDAKSALQIINQAKIWNVALVEQPVKAWDYVNLKYVRDNSALAIFADESVFNLRDAVKVINGQMVDGINLKLMKSGGLYATRTIYDLATSFNLPCMAGCMLESPIGLAAMASFVASRSNIKYLDLDPITMLKENPVIGGLTNQGAMLTLSEDIGLGIKEIQGLELVMNIGG